MNNFLKRLLSSVILIPIILYLILLGSYFLIFFIILCFLLSCYEWNLIVKKINVKIYGIFFLIFSYYSFYMISLDTKLVFFILLICISTDIGGYFFGKLFKGPKLTKISPNKTYAGMIGSFFFSLISLIIFIEFFGYLYEPTKFFLITLIISIVSQIGDIIVSFFKRVSNIKDTGNLIPGHGGLLDRIDGMIFVFPTLYLSNLTQL